MTGVGGDGAGGQELDDLLTRWGSDQTGPFRRGGGRHAAAEPPSVTYGDELGPVDPPAWSRPAASPDRAAPPEPRPAAAPRRMAPPDPRPSLDRPTWSPGGGAHPAPRSRPAPTDDPSRPDPRVNRDDPLSRPAPADSPSRAGRGDSRSRPAAAEHPSWPAAGEHPSWPGAGGPSWAGGNSPSRPAAGEHPSWPGDGGSWSRAAAPVEHPSWPGVGAGNPSWPGGGPTGPWPGGPPERTGRRHRADGVPPSWDPRAAAPNGSAAVGLHSTLLGPAADPRPPAPPRLDHTGAYAEWLESRARPGGVGLLERPPDRYGLRPHDPYAAPDPAAGDDGDDGTPGRHRRAGARPRWLRTVRWVGAVLGVLLLLGGGFAVYQYKTLSGNINRTDALSLGDKSIRDAAKQLDAENYLLIGSDTRAGANGRYEENAGQVSGERSDTTILAHLSPKRDKVVLISFPRDAWVSLPACTKVGGGTEPAHDGQFNEAFSIGGPSCTVLAVQKLTGIAITHYVQVDFTGFKTMVDAVGGVPICSTAPLYDKESGLRMAAGTTRLKGEQALAYVRARYGIGDGSDLGRIQRQQRFLGAMVRSATSSKLLLNPVALTKFLGAATKSLTLDRKTSFGDLKALADQLHGLDPKKVSFLTAPIANAAYTPPGFPQPPSGVGGARVLLDDVAGRTLYDSIINDKPAPAAGSTTAPKPKVLTVAPADVTVRVLNGVGVGGMADRVGTALQGAGFTTVEPDNAPRTPTTTVRYAPAQAEAAKTLAAAVPGAVLQPDASTTLDLVVGANYSTVKPVRVGDPATAKAAPAPKTTRPAASAAPAVTAADASCT